jgi:Zn-dependent peptidase ImmA (M78 family)
MSYWLERSQVQQRAVRVLKDYQINKLPINPKKVAEKAGISVLPKNDCEPGVSGMLLRNGENFGILYATYLNNPGFENFSIAHELGHYFLDGHPEQVFKNSNIHASTAEFVTSDPIEREADTFAASLLMPEDIFKDQLSRFEKGFTCIESMAKLCNTSLTATAIRYAELTEDMVVIIVSKNNIVDFCCISDSIFKLKDIEKPKKGDKIPKDTATEAITNNPALLAKSEGKYAETRFMDWLECRSSRDAAEEAIGLGKYGRVLTVIS